MEFSESNLRYESKANDNPQHQDLKLIFKINKI